MIGRIGAIHRASMRLAQITDAETLAREVIEILHDVVHHDYAAICLVEGDRLRPFAVSVPGIGIENHEQDKAYIDSFDLKVGENVTGWVAKHGKSLLVDDPKRDPRYLKIRPDVRSEVCVPMLTSRGVMGVINLESTRDKAYTESELRVLEIIASPLAVAIERSTVLGQAARLKNLLGTMKNKLAKLSEQGSDGQQLAAECRNLEQMLDRAIKLINEPAARPEAAAPGHLATQHEASTAVADADGPSGD